MALDFVKISSRVSKGVIELYPTFEVNSRCKDLMIRGQDFYAVWVEDRSVWSTDQQDVIDIIDNMTRSECAQQASAHPENSYSMLLMSNSDTHLIDKFHDYCHKQMRDNYHVLDETLVFSNDKTTRSSYSSKSLSYPLEEGPCPSWDRIIEVLYSPEERHKIEWGIGSIVTGGSKKLQKFMVLYGEAGTGKSTILNIMQMLFDGYYSMIDARSLCSVNESFALEQLKTNPLVGIQHDGDLSKISDNSKLNSVVSHEQMMVNEKFKTPYQTRFKTFLWMGTNTPVKITDSRSGVLRRLIDISPTGRLLSRDEYDDLMDAVPFELGHIAYKCAKIFEGNEKYYDHYVPKTMIEATNIFYDFVNELYEIHRDADGVAFSEAWKFYKAYCEDSNVSRPMQKVDFTQELKNYFRGFSKEKKTLRDGSRPRSCFYGFRLDKLNRAEKEYEERKDTSWLSFEEQESIFDKVSEDYPAQLTNADGYPRYTWDSVVTVLKNINTKELHYVRVPEQHIVIDFDIKDSDGNKNYDLNVKAASKWPPTYAELSKSGAGIHLHYIYDGDVSTLARLYSKDIEIKVFSGKSSLRRKLTKCNNLEIRHISPGPLPLREVKPTVNKDVMQTEAGILKTIKKCLNKEVHSATKPNVEFIKEILDRAYSDESLVYDVQSIRPAVINFAAGSTHNAEYCLKLVKGMHFRSKNEALAAISDKDIIFFDCEVFPNLFLINWKLQGEGKPVVRMINPAPEEVEELCKYRLIGFNNRRYDNHILYARMMGYTNEMLFNLSNAIINDDSGSNHMFLEAYNLAYTDIYDFASDKRGLKKWEIFLGIHHQELGFKWNEPVPEDKWEEVAEYCDNDVISTEAVFNYLQADFTARCVLADVANLPISSTTNKLTQTIIFGKNKEPQGEFNYRDMGDESEIDHILYGFDEFSAFDKQNRPIFPGYRYDFGKSTYRGEEVGEGGYVYAEPGIYTDVALLDIASMHPSSVVAENLFGDRYTRRYSDILNARLAIKHKDYEKARSMLGGVLGKYLTDEGSSKQLAQALKIAINSVYGLTKAKFDNPFRDIRNKDNIVAKRGALFMVNLKHEVQKRGFTVAHIKTDSIKIPNATPDIIQFVMDYGKAYGYNFEHEATYDRICLVNDAVYIARYYDGVKHVEELSTGEEIETPWTATGAQFAVPYVFKTCFTHTPIVFKDKCETKEVQTALYLGFEDKPDSDPIFIGKTGRFCPILPGHGGGHLLASRPNAETGEVKYVAATGTKGYFWLESETVENLGMDGDIDLSYYEELVLKARNTISKYGDYEWFTA